MRHLPAFGLLLGLLAGFSARAVPGPEVPAALQPWVPWVLEQVPEHACPFSYATDSRRCSWPSELSLELTATGGRFQQRWSLYREGWVTLPGGEGKWPHSVTVNGKELEVAAEEDAPALFLPAGDHLIAGQFQWQRLPEALPVPLASGIIRLSIEGQPVAFPYIDEAEGRLWIQRAEPGAAEQKEEDRLELQVFRRLTDELPLRVESLLRLQVSGAQRELVLDFPLLPEAIPLRIDSPLPARLEPDGRLRVQVRPGSWTLRVEGRFPKEALAVAAPAASPNWPASEVWAFDARPQLRLVELSGATPIDPRQTNLPEEWRNLPSFRLQPGERLGFQVQRRGDPTPEPNRLQLQRDLWLDFSGAGYTVRDRFSGSLTSGWRLQAQDGMQLGRAVLDGQPQFVTRMDGRPGLEVRRGSLDLVAESRLEGGIGAFNAVGWQQDFSGAGIKLHLPPGWRVFSVSGVDNLPHTWLQSWTLLDLFLVLMTAIAVGHLWGWPWAVLALASLTLLWHEPDAPRIVWLNIVAAVALLRVVPATGRLHGLVTAYRTLSLLALVLISIPFIIQEVRTGIYPQLERPWQEAQRAGGMEDFLAGVAGMGAMAPMMDAPAPAPAEALYDMAERKKEIAEELLPRSAPPLPSSVAPRQARKAMAKPAPAPLVEMDPKALIQTGPGIPQWQWNTLQLGWNGPVEQGQQVSIYYLSPGQNLLLNLLRILLLLLLAYRLVGRVEWRQWLPAKAAAAMLLLPGLGLLLPANAPEAAEFPPAELLEQLRQRLVKPPTCLPACADLQRLELTAEPGQLRMRLQLHVLQRVALPLPGSRAHWLPQRVTLKGEPVRLQLDAEGVPWALLEPGMHLLTLEGALPPKGTVQIPLAMPPRAVTSEISGWTLEGLDQEGVAGSQLQLVRPRDKAAQETQDQWAASELPPFVMIERTLRLGLDWTVSTQVSRLSPPGVAVVLRVPLLPGESVTTPGLELKEGQLQVTLDGAAQSLSWESVLKKEPEILLRAPEVGQWVELWRVEVSPIWHMESEGIPVVHHTDSSGQWHPEWRPWPGESVRLAISRPEGGEGNTLTIQQASLEANPGQRSADAVLKLQLQASQGGRHSIGLPEDARLQSVTIDGKAQPIRQQGREVSLPLRPGSQTIELQWRTDGPLTTRFESPAVELNAPAVNLAVKTSLPADRWLLLVGGPSMGPAVLFWGVLAALALGAWVLGRLPDSPLKHYQWLLLGLGLTQGGLFAALLVVGWLLALGYRGRMAPPTRPWLFDLMQLALAYLSFMALSALFDSVQQGLLGSPDMMVAGNSSSAYLLQWYQDRAMDAYPQAWVISLPIMVYRVVMLAWAMWLAFALLRWLRWGWGCFSHHGLWLKTSWGRKAKPVEPSVEPAEGQDAGVK